MNLKLAVIVSVRTNSKRLPAKAFLPINGKPSCLFLLDRLKNGLNFSLHVATTTHPSDDFLYSLLTEQGYSAYRGSENNVFERLLSLSETLNLDYLVRITADCPLLDSKLVNDLVAQALTQEGWILATTKGEHPAGFDIEILSLKEMIRIRHNLTAYEEEHVSAHFYVNLRESEILRLKHPHLSAPNGSYLLDTLDDFLFLNEFIRRNGANFSPVKFNL